MDKLNKFVTCNLTSDIDFLLVGKCLHIRMDRNGLITNMQYDQSAFEAWAICLKCNYPNLISDVVIEWEPLEVNNLEPSESGHYYRFLYRAYKFQTNFPSWVSISPSVPGTFLSDMEHWVLNYPHQGSTESEKKNPNAEAHLERHLLSLMQKHFQVADHQLPVGLFHESVSSKRENARTTRGLSQIDLWSIDDGMLSVYELKNDVNVKVGIVSEIQFYCNVIKDLTEHRFNYPKDFWSKRKYYRHTKELADYIYPDNRISKVIGVLLADNRHPLVTDDVIKLMSTNMSGIEYVYKSVQDFEKDLY